MDDRHIDELITKALHSRIDTEIPPDGFFEAVATRFTSRRRHVLTVARIAASVGLVLTVTASLLFLTLSGKSTPTAEVSHNSEYLEGVRNVQDRIDRISDTQNELRASIDQEFPFFHTTPQ